MTCQNVRIVSNNISDAIPNLLLRYFSYDCYSLHASVYFCKLHLHTLCRVAQVSEDLCGSGNYTAEMSLNLGRGVEPGGTVPALGNLRVVINLKTNNSHINLEVTSCCLSPTVQPDLSSSTCCLFSRYTGKSQTRQGRFISR